MIQENIYHVTKEDFDDVRVSTKLSLLLHNKYTEFKMIKDFYDDELSDVLILSRPRSLKLFFRNINNRLKFIFDEIKKMPKSEVSYKVKLRILIEIDTFIKRNIVLARQFMKQEKVYSFESEGFLHNDDIV